MRFVEKWTWCTSWRRAISRRIREFLLRPDVGAALSGRQPYRYQPIDGLPETRSYSLVGEAFGGYRIAVRAPDSRGGSRYMWAARRARGSKSPRSGLAARDRLEPKTIA